MTEEIKVALTREEGQVAINLMDVAVKSLGLQAAHAALTIAQKISVAMTAEQAPSEA
jgi:hypothetical protein